MPRRNSRQSENYQPLDLTPPEPAKSPAQRRPHAAQADRIAAKRQAAEERQRNARINHGIDWTVCLVPGCGEELIMWGSPQHPPERRDHTLELPICYSHAAVIWKDLVGFYTSRGEFIEAIADVNEQLSARFRREDEARRVKRVAENGTIYYIRIGDLVKVGWTSDLSGRLKSYGASAELLVSYPGSRSDETALHRQLRPALAKGREWYYDGDVINHFLTDALERYGPPRQFEFLWTEPKAVIQSRRGNRQYRGGVAQRPTS